jgi:transcriptional regulator with XRE-family HTH domain
MNSKVSPFGKLCRKLRIDMGLTMAETAEKLGCKQNHITKIEQGEANPTQTFLEKNAEVYGLTGAGKTEFIALALSSSKRLVLELDKATIIPKDDLAKLLAVLAFDLKNPYPNTKEWKPVDNAIGELLKSIEERSLHMNVVRLRDPGNSHYPDEPVLYW